MILRILPLLFLLAAPLQAAEQMLYLAAGQKISSYRIDSSTGKLAPHQELPLPGAGPFSFLGTGRLYAMAVHGGKDKKAPAMATVLLGRDGKLELENIAPVNLRGGSLKTNRTGTFIAGNHYGPGKASIWKLKDGVYVGETLQELTLEERAHCAVFSPDDRWLLVPATGPNKVFINRFDAATGIAKPNDPPFALGPQGENDARQPRHLVFHPTKNFVYTSNEREKPGVAMWNWDPARGTLKVAQNLVSVPKGFKGSITTADLHLTPDAKFLYVSNRDLTDRKAKTGNDSIVGYRVNPESGKLTLIGHTPCEHIPRSFTINTTGEFLYVAGQGDDRLGAYRIDRKDGTLEKIAHYQVGARPIWVETITLP